MDVWPCRNVCGPADENIALRLKDLTWGSISMTCIFYGESLNSTTMLMTYIMASYNGSLQWKIVQSVQ